MQAQPGLSVAGRILAVLGAFSADHSTLTLSELSRRTGLPLTTTHRITRELLNWGALERDQHGRYRIGLRLWEVASLSPRGLGLREAALPFLEDLYEATHENAQLAVLEDGEVLYVERIAGRRAVTVLTRVGGRFTAHATGVGLVLLANASTEIQERYLDAPLARYTAKTITDPRRLRRVLADVRRTGVAVSDGQVTLDSLSVAAPVLGPAGEVVAAVSLVVRAAGAEAQLLVPPVVAAARGISRALGWRPDASHRSCGQ